MSSAILYIRVSTDEQAEKGYSLSYQEDALRNYCVHHSIEVLQIYKEDYSAKTFKRPSWNLLMHDLKKWSVSGPLHILFTKWDRFSRNTSDAYSMINRMQKKGVELTAIEQPIDLTVPENKLILAIYLAAPEVENDRRGLEVKKGMRKAQESGKWIGGAPMGYRTYYTPDGDKLILPNEPESSLIVYAFERMYSGSSSVRDIYKELTELGLRCSLSNFYHILRNPVYAGMVRVSTDEKGVGKLVLGQHTGLITEQLFGKVQQRFKKKSNEQLSGGKINPLFPLKGFVGCDICARLLTASGSRGRAGRIYYYYHCSSPGHSRIRLTEANRVTIEFLKALHPVEPYLQLFKDATVAAINSKNNRVLSSQLSKQRKIDLFLNRIVGLKEMFVLNVLSLTDFARMKMDLELKIKVLGEAISKEQVEQMLNNSALERAVFLFSHLDEFYQVAGNERLSRFIEWLFGKGWKWQNGDFSQILQAAVKVIFGRYNPGNRDLNSKLVQDADERVKELAYLIQE